MEKFIGTWRLESSENFDAYMKAIGVGFVLRKVGNTVKPDVQFLRNEDGTCTMKTISTFKNSEITFELDKEFEETTIDGRKVRSTMTMTEGGELVHKQASEPETVIERKLQGDGDNEMVCTVKAGDVVCTRAYRKLNTA
ncbi:hypothetical protein BOX15_Mlig012300g1 [Macrostomum lignano]|uniref:Cytosolic fatty-acid binding proteins domain-containing protein n=1 Tax=Macrostomum lignano TaxID=282301 RepID=A0A267DM55_9PLAT|nr:hypothetical protein BOX15_Mlig020263g9 [Macrostomum lignano]PAA86894.1 hypothetical protein BOX15_Mlig012300g1 [Macrostomum lignano]